MSIAYKRIPKELVDVATRDGRVVPHPWARLWDLLDGKIQKPNGSWEPPLPLILDGWYYSNDSEKRSRFLEHLEWAVSRGQTDVVLRFLESLAADEWYYGESQ